MRPLTAFLSFSHTDAAEHAVRTLARSGLLLSSELLKKSNNEIAHADWKYAGLYALRLAASRAQMPLRIAEPLYTRIENDGRKSGEKIFDYLDPRNRALQLEMEHAATEHLKKIGAYLPPNFK